MADSELEKARERLDDEYGQVRRHIDKVRNAFADVEHAGPEDDLYRLLGELEKRVHEAQTGGVIGSGAHGHRRALEEYNALKG